MKSSITYLVIIYLLIVHIKLSYSQELDKNTLLYKDSLKIEFLNKKAIEFKEISKDSALNYANKALDMAKEKKLVNLMAVSHYNIGVIYEYYKDIDEAEKNYLNWYNVRKQQSEEKFRWALKGLRKFYSAHKQIEKLLKIEEEWMSILDKQYEKKEISPWMRYEDPVEHYRLSMYPVFFNLIELKEYFTAEKLLIHMAEKCPEAIRWGDSDMLYFMVERQLLSEKDTATLLIWYDHWFQTMKKFNQNNGEVRQILGYISEKYIREYGSHSDYSIKYVRKFMEYAHQLGGNESLNNFVLLLYRKWGITDDSKILINLLALKLCTTNDNCQNSETYYGFLDISFGRIIQKNEPLKTEIKELLAEIKNTTKNKQLKKWCKQKMKQLKQN